MAACDIDLLLTSANTNRFTEVAESPSLTNAVAIQLLSEITSNTQTADELLASACASGFACVESEEMFYALANQLVCNSL